MNSLKTYVVLLRGVMPTGKNKVPMAQLRDVLSKAGFLNVRTYIQSGNALLETHLPAREVEKQVHELIEKHIGADLAVIVRTGEQLQQVLDNNPFTREDISRTFFVLFAEPPPPQKAKELMTEDFIDEKLVINETAGYMYIPGNAARSKLSNVKLEKKLDVTATTRNFNTVKKLVELSNINV